MKGSLATFVLCTKLVRPAPAPGQVVPRSAQESANASVRFDAAGRLVLDVWNLQSYFSAPASVILRWQAPLAGEAHLHLEYADADPN